MKQKKSLLEKGEEVLGFNPISKSAKTFITELSPDQAQHILDFFNNDNRKLSKAQVNAIAKSINKDGWMFDGQSITFNVEGNLTEGQHRLNAIVNTQTVAKVSISLGVITSAFTKCAPAKPRTAADEIQRKDPSATSSDCTTLRQILKRRQGDQLTMKNAIEQWEKWKLYIRAANKLVDEFFDRISEHRSWARTYTAWAALMISVGEAELVSTFMSLIQEEFLSGNASCLTREFRKFFRENSEMSSSERTALMWSLLCICGDRLKKEPTGEIQLGLDMPDCSHQTMKRKGFYRKFLDDPQEIGNKVVFNFDPDE
tara:strand:- start:44 stop:985 length:942 start_codon:yes stop_codon:yes gene_type:complete